MNIKVKKRDGRLDSFSVDKIKAAVLKCYNCNNVGIDYLDSLLKAITDDLSDFKEVDVEDIQNIVVKHLKRYNKAIARSYQEYREWRAKSRDLRANGDRYAKFFDIVSGKENDITKENSNKDARVIYTKRDLFAGMQSRDIWEKFMVSKEALKLHKECVIHVHDTDYRAMKSITNCSIFNLQDMLDNGTVINGKRIEQPKSLRTATTIATQIVMGIGSMQYGGITMSIAHLAPYVNKSRRKIRRNIEKSLERLNLPINGIDKEVEIQLNNEVKDAMQTLQYQLNSMTANSGQSPFITIWMDINEHSDELLKNDTALLITELVKQRIEGMYSETGHNISPAFPKLVYVLDENNINEGSKYYDVTKVCAECSSKRLTPDYISGKIMRSVKDGGLTPVMGCRSMVFPYYEDGKYKTWGRFNIGVMSVNLPLVALKSKSKKDFFSNLTKAMDIIKIEQLKVAEDLANSSSDVAPMLWNYGAFARLPKGSKLRSLIYGGYSTCSIGYAGVAEAVQRFGIDYLTEDGQAFGLEIVKFMNDYCNKIREETNLGFSLYGTPLESTTQKFANSLKKYPPIKGVNDRDYVTNSYHVPVYRDIDAFSKLDFEAPFQEYSAGGSISYIEVPDVSKNIPAVIKVMQYIYDHIMYAEINTRNNDVCYECGYKGEIENYERLKWRCPECGNSDKSKLSVVRRTCGYIGSSFWNEGRESEISERVTHL